MANDDSTGQQPHETQDAPDGYQNLVRVDQGGFATVYRALDTRFDRTVALKVMRSDSLNDRQLRRFNAECLATGRVSSHPNIVTVYDAGMTRGHRPWLAMEYCSGGSLARKVSTHGPLPVAEVISIGARLCGALSAAHEAGILHRDVKPPNVLLTSYNEPALADFGIASVVVEDDAGSIAAQTAAYTVVHAAPEILEGMAGTAAADVYSLGSTLYTLLAGRAPFAKEARTGLAPLVTRILLNDLPVITRPGVPPQLEELLRWSMAASPQDRPSCAAALGASLVEVGLQLDGGGTPSQPGRSARPAAMTPTPVTHASASNHAVSEVDEQSLQVTRQPHIQGAAPVPAGAAPAPVRAAPTRTAASMSARRLVLILVSALGVMVAGFTTWGLSTGGPQAHALAPIDKATRTDPASDIESPKRLVVAKGHDKGELIVTWLRPIRPSVVATVIYQGPGSVKARAIVNYATSPGAAPQARVYGLPSGQRVCLSAAHLVSLHDTVTSAVSRPVCAVPR